MTKDQQRRLTAATELLEKAAAMVRGVTEELQDTFDSRSDKWQESAAANALEEKIADLEGWADDIDDTRQTGAGYET